MASPWGNVIGNVNVIFAIAYVDDLILFGSKNSVNDLGWTFSEDGKYYEWFEHGRSDANKVAKTNSLEFFH